MRLAAAVALVLLLLAAATAGNYLLTAREIQRSQQAWCPLLTVASQRPPRRPDEAQRRAFTELLAVSAAFGCPPARAK